MFDEDAHLWPLKLVHFGTGLTNFDVKIHGLGLLQRKLIPVCPQSKVYLMSPDCLIWNMFFDPLIVHLVEGVIRNYIIFQG